MKRFFFILMGAVFAALMTLILFVDSLPTVFSSVMAFPFEQLGVALRALALAGNIGNGFALTLCMALSLIPIISVIRHKNQKDYLGENEMYEHWSFKKDGASLISRLLFEEATDINFYVGRAVNPAHQNPDLPINFNIKMNLVEELSDCLKKMGKRIKVSYF